MNICVTQEFVLNWSGVLWKTQSRVSVVGYTSMINTKARYT